MTCCRATIVVLIDLNPDNRKRKVLLSFLAG